ncbi:MAG: type II secretion system ATPase GspE [Phycisphaerae bacterium]|jgi:general secretion pathway protein E/type IV pilus assembly protein PilB|nr:type II secretion system ATPase GspE [Phycisphaerae bacterium]
MSIAEILLEKGLVTPAHLTQAMELRRTDGLRLDRALVQIGCLTEEELLEVLSEQLSIPLIDLASVEISNDALSAIPPKLVFRKNIVPVSRENGTLTVATSDPFDLYSFDELRLLTGLEINPVLATQDEISKIIKAHFGVGGDTIDEMMSSDDLEVISETAEGAEDLVEMAQEASVIKLVNEIFVEAIGERASDIHIEPYENDLHVRFRIDGVLQPASVPPQIRSFQAAIISRIKIMSNLNIAEKRLPQDGRIKLQVGGRQIDIRVSVIPMLFGEGIVMRILDKSTVMFTLPELGMDDNTFGMFNELIAQPHGIILVTGPTGSGKTTTLYAALQEIVSDEIKVLTVEDPVEYHLDGINQIQINPKINMTFSRGLRAILRHDPDAVMIGEIRDAETAEAAIQASLTGHLVLSTLHTNDACSAPTRLLDMGVEPFLVASTLAGAMAQRLVRAICPECKESYLPDRDQLPRDLDMELPEGAELYRGVGCRKCRNTGYHGRSGLFELMVANEVIRERVMSRAPTSKIVAAAAENGMHMLRADGWDKVRAGVTTPAEVLRVACG